jgi:hypothetical protein
MEELSTIAENTANHFGCGKHEVRAFLEIIEFLEEYPDDLSLRKSKNRPKPGTNEFYQLLADRFFGSRVQLRTLKTNTVPDEMVSFILQQYFDYPDSEVERIKVEHSLAMVAENLVGYLLEMYIGKNLEKLGWVWCSGDFIKAVDLIRKKKDGSWELFQIKNRDNSENSSSSAIRAGTDIRKWFRTYSRTGKTNWENFPDDEAQSVLSEEGFKSEVVAYMKRLKEEESRS